MSYYKRENGLSNVGSYQISGIPYATASITAPALGSAPLEITFPLVTKSITVVNEGSSLDLRVGFSALGVTGSAAGSGNYYTLCAGNNKLALPDIRVERLYLLSNTAAIVAGVSIVAGLASVRAGSTPDNWSGSLGVG